MLISPIKYFAKAFDRTVGLYLKLDYKPKCKEATMFEIKDIPSEPLGFILEDSVGNIMKEVDRCVDEVMILCRINKIHDACVRGVYSDVIGVNLKDNILQAFDKKLKGVNAI